MENRPVISGTTEAIVKLASETGKSLTQTALDEFSGAIGRLARVAERGSGAFLLAAGAVFVILGTAFTSIPEVLLKADHTATGEPQLIALTVCGAILMLAGAASNLVAYKWRIDARALEQARDLESLRLQAELRETGIGAIVETDKLIAEQAKLPPRSPKNKPDIPDSF